jgi:hypothetical protein
MEVSLTRRPAAGIAKEVRDLIRRMSLENPVWGATKIHGELLKLGIQVAQSKCRGQIGRRRPGTPSSAIIWRELRRLIYLWFRRLRFNNYSRFWFSGTNDGSSCGLR